MRPQYPALKRKRDDMPKRFLAIWFRFLKTDGYMRRQPRLREIPFVLAAADHGRMVITEASESATLHGIERGMVVADARVLLPSLEVIEDQSHLPQQLLTAMGEWCIRFTPVVAIDLPDGLILDICGCTHLWGGEEIYITTIHQRFEEFGYYTKMAIADTVAAAWALSRFGKNKTIVEPGKQSEALLPLHPASLRVETEIIERLEKLGLHRIRDFISMPRSILQKRFGAHFIKRINQALGTEEEFIEPLVPVELYMERLPCLEPIVTATGIEIALKKLLEDVCLRLRKEEKGLRKALFKSYRIDHKMITMEVGTHRATHNALHLFKLFEPKLADIEPGLGIELFVLEAPVVEEVSPAQVKIWESSSGLDSMVISELIDRLASRFGNKVIHRYLPAEHYWPERSFREASSLQEKESAEWKLDIPRPIHILSHPELIQVTAPIPDYPPMSFRYKGKLHKVIKADGPERIEQEWWLNRGRHRDYYAVEDEEGNRYWLFRSGHYDAEKSYQWFIHGFFA
jgi:protein ImuB